MNSPVENILQDYFKTSLLQDVSAEQLSQLINDHPYHGAAYFLLAKKLYTPKETGYENALQKAALHFPNELWFHFSLNEDEKDELPENNIAVEKNETAENETVNLTNLKIEHVNNNEEKNITEQTTETDTEEIKQEQDEDESSEQNSEADNAINERLNSMLQQQASAFEKPIETTEIPIESTPYHRVDYFDSQGIKLDEEKTDDKLGIRLKRFTEWLKQMKRINPNVAELTTDEAGESKVKTMAEHSNENEEIATEAMAEVLIKQGKPEQAIQIYEKLSFINPSKSAYFAAKIEELKG
ncbi:MAG TPA: hypothetical protein VGI61_07460 [Parafilimonas sp.]